MAGRPRRTLAVPVRAQRHFWVPSRLRGGPCVSMVARVGGVAWPGRGGRTKASQALSCRTLRGRDVRRRRGRGVPDSALRLVSGAAPQGSARPEQVGVVQLAPPTGPSMGAGAARPGVAFSQRRPRHWPSKLCADGRQAGPGRGQWASGRRAPRAAPGRFCCGTGRRGGGRGGLSPGLAWMGWDFG